MKKKYNHLLLSLSLLLVSYLIIRYPLYEIHYMQDWSLFMFVFSLVLSLLAFLRHKYITMYISVFSYSLAFVLGQVFKKISYDPGGGKLSNSWIIWTLSILIITFISWIIEVIFLKNKKHPLGH